MVCKKLKPISCMYIDLKIHVTEDCLNKLLTDKNMF